MAEPNPLDNEELYSAIEFPGGVTTPGVVTLSGHDREIDWDVKVGPGTTGGTTTLKAQKLADFTATFYLADRDDFEAWPEIREILMSSIKGKGKGLDVYHPDLERNDIKSVVLKGIGGTVHDKKGGQTIAVKLLEYRPPKPINVSPVGSAASKTDPNAAAKAELAGLTAQYKATPWG